MDFNRLFFIDFIVVIDGVAGATVAPVVKSALFVVETQASDYGKVVPFADSINPFVVVVVPIWPTFLFHGCVIGFSRRSFHFLFAPISIAGILASADTKQYK